jgi:hypothetical protein
MKKLVFRVLVLTPFLVMALAACSSAPKVTRVDAGTQTDLSGYWNDTDVRIVCQALIDECLASPRVAQTSAQLGRNPKVIVGSFKNESNEHMDTSVISKMMEVTIFNSGVMDFVAGGAGREELRGERADQDDWGSREAGGTDLLNEEAADFMFTGTVKTVIDKAGNQTVRTYFVSAEMTNISTNARMWMGQNSEIKKIVVQPKNKL